MSDACPVRSHNHVAKLMTTQPRNTCVGHPALLLITAFIVVGGGVQVSAQNPQQLSEGPDFSRDIRPILSNACFSCHGPDEQTREVDLRLDTEEGLFQIRDERAIVKRDDAEGSELVTRILSSDPDIRMPPPGSKKTLTDEQRQLLVQWVKSGAAWNQHWAFVAPSKPVVPQIDAPQVAGWPRN